MLRQLTATIANGASLSDVVELPDVAGFYVMGIQMPAAWTAASLTFQGSADGGAYGDVYDVDGTEVTVTTAAGRYITLDPATLAGLTFLKVRSGTAAAAVAQGAERKITLLLRKA